MLKTIRQGAIAKIISEKAFCPELLRFARKTIGLSQADFSEMIGLKGGKSLISKYESGEQVPRSVTVQAIGMLVEKWFRERWKLVPSTPASFNPFDYKSGVAPTLTVDLAKPGFTEMRA